MKEQTLKTKALTIARLDLAARPIKPTGCATLKGAKTRNLTSHEMDSVTAASTSYLHLKLKTELRGDRIEGHIVVPTESKWRLLKV